MDWLALLAAYPILNDLAHHMPGIKERIEKLVKKNSPESTFILLQIESMQQISELRDHILTSSMAAAKLANQTMSEEDFISAWRFAKKLIGTIREV